MEKRNKHIALKHIYLINNNSRASQYGIGSYIKQIVKFIRLEGGKVSIINLSSEQKNPEIKEVNGIECFYLPCPTYVIAEKYLSRYYQAVGTFLALHIENNSDNIFHFNYLLHSPLQKVLKERFPQSLTLLTVHYLNWHFALKGNTTQFLQIISKEEYEQSDKEKDIIKEYNQDKSFFKEVDCVICLANYTKHLLIQHYGVVESKIHLIRNAVSLTDVTILTNQEKIDKRRQLHISTEEKMILFVGRLDNLKGIEFLVEAYRNVLVAFPDSRLWIIGDGDYNLGLNKADNIWNRITLTGKIPQETLFNLYQIADIGVIPSLCEQCSYVAVEMMKFGLPVVGTTANGLKEMFVENSENMVELKEVQDNVLFPVDQLSQKIVRLLSDIKRSYSTLGALECYSMERMEQEIIKLYMNN